VTGPLVGGFIGGHVGMRAVFLGTSALMACGAIYGWMVKPSRSPSEAVAE
jgi:predicted MFS family arabinose efflux permease